MVRPKFVIQHFIACSNVNWEGYPGRGVGRILEGVSYLYPVAANVEAPSFPEMWLYARMFLLNGVAGKRRFWVELARSEPDRYFDPLTTWPVGEVEFRPEITVYNEAWPLRRILFPVRGAYEFRLMYSGRVRGVRQRILAAKEFIQIETLR